MMKDLQLRHFFIVYFIFYFYLFISHLIMIKQEIFLCFIPHIKEFKKKKKTAHRMQCWNQVW